MNLTDYEKIHTSADGSCQVTINYNEPCTIENAHGVPVDYPESWTVYVAEIHNGEAMDWETAFSALNPTQPIVIANVILKEGYQWHMEYHA